MAVYIKFSIQVSSEFEVFITVFGILLNCLQHLLFWEPDNIVGIQNQQPCTPQL